LDIVQQQEWTRGLGNGVILVLGGDPWDRLLRRERVSRFLDGVAHVAQGEDKECPFCSLPFR
jgi:hypothetical protein